MVVASHAAKRNRGTFHRTKVVKRSVMWVREILDSASFIEATCYVVRVGRAFAMTHLHTNGLRTTIMYQ